MVETIESVHDCRPEVRAFAVAMENKLRENDHKKPWQECNLNYFLFRIEEEKDEMREAFEKWLLTVWGKTEIDDYKAAVRECEIKMANEAVDIANFAMFFFSMSLNGRYSDSELERIRELDINFDIMQR